MAVMITDLCINCDACIDECPVSAIAGEGDSPRDDWEYTYVKPEKCIECVGHAEVPACAAACPTEECIVWDMPYTADYNDYYVNSSVTMLSVQVKNVDCYHLKSLRKRSVMIFLSHSANHVKR